MNTADKITELERELARLPQGSIVKKNIKGKEYFYHRINKNNVRKETYVDFSRVDDLNAQIEKRKNLEKELKSLRGSVYPARTTVSYVRESPSEYSFKTYIRIGRQLKTFAKSAEGLKKRECYSKIQEYIYGKNNNKVFILYGLRRTGKTTLIRQTILDMSEDDFNQTAFIQTKSSDTLADVNEDLKVLELLGYKYVFIDEVTLMQDFIEGAALFSDIFAASGMKIVLSGTDSLGFVFSEDEQLYDRCIMLHTTFIPYREFEEVLGISGVDEYIRFGGTMSVSGTDYNKDSSFSDSKKADEYIDNAIAKNIQHSLRLYQNGFHFRGLKKLYEKNELTSAINRVVEDMNHHFTVETLTRTFRSNDLAVSASNLRKDRNNPTNILDNINQEKINEFIKKSLDILNREEQQVNLNEIHVAEIKEYLDLLDLTEDIEVQHIPRLNENDFLTVIAQPGMRYVQASALIDALLRDKTFDQLDVSEKKRIQERIKSEIKGRMLEEIVLLETKFARPDMHVFKLQFAVGEFDMVVADEENLTCEIYEVKYSGKAAPEQCRHLLDEKKIRATEHSFGKITKRCVLYRGKTNNRRKIKYQNVEEYLKSL